jgi:hypothetical protein
VGITNELKLGRMADHRNRMASDYLHPHAEYIAMTSQICGRY